jgi:diguanylate cyclase (GGDEF)-like protein/PAS domain S-box-containing protein
VHNGGDYALIHVLDPARAAQYSALVEQHHLAGARARSEEEARFHAQRLGPAALIIAEVRQSPDGFELLRRLRRGRRPQVAPALLISSSLKVRDEALRLRDQLDIVEVLSGSQPLSTVQAAVERAIRRGPRNGRRPRLAPAPPKPPPLARDDLLQEVARDLSAEMVVAWLGADDSGELSGWFGWDRLLVPMIGERDDWKPFRNLAAAAAVRVADARADGLLAGSAVVRSGMVRSFAGAPIVDDAGQPMGALWVADDRPGRFGAEELEALGVWAQRLGAGEDAQARRQAARRLRALPTTQAAPAPSSIPESEAMEQLLAHSSEGFIATDAQDRIAFANPAVAKLLGLRSHRFAGVTRARLIDLARQKAGLDPRTAAALAEGTTAQQVITLKKSERVVRWETRPLPLGNAMGRMDQITDVTAEVAERETRVRLARIDPLTWLANRRGFDEALAREISRSLRFKTRLSLLLLGIQGRDQLEPQESELLLREVAWLVAEMSRGHDYAARLEDDSLAVILPGESAEGAKAFAGRLYEELQELRTRRARKVTLAAGVALFDRGEEAAQMLGRARATMLEAAAPQSDPAREPATH